MRKIIIILATTLSCILTIGCSVLDMIDGSGVEKVEIRDITDFTQVTTSTNIDIFVSQGEEFLVEVKADQNVINYVRTELKGDHLYVEYERGISYNNRGVKTRVYITLPIVESINSESSGDVHVESNINANSLKLSASSSGDIEFLDISCTNLDIKASSSGDIEGGMVNCENELYIRASSSGDVEISAITPYCSVEANSSGDVKIVDGECDFCDVSTSSSSDTMLYGFVCREVDATASSSGSIFLYVTDKLTAKASSGGDIIYMGNPTVDRDVSSGGTVRPR